MKVGFIGLGMQGGAMAEMILRAGLDLTIWARRMETRDRFQGLGANLADSPAELASQVDHLCLCVTAEPDVREVLFEGGALAALRPGALLSLHSTVAPEFNIEAAERAADGGVRVLDAPVSGSAAGALARRLVVFVGADEDALAGARPVYETYGDPILHFGDVGAGTRAKLINNLLMITHLGLAHRALEMGQALGLSPGLLRQAVMAGTGTSFSMGTLGRCQEPAFAAHVHSILTKDRELALDSAKGAPMSDFDRLSADTLDVLSQLVSGDARLIPTEELA